MVHISVIEARLSQMGLHVSSLFRPEVNELQRILVENEELISVVPGRYFGGFALLAATNRRLILVDKKVAVLTTEIIPYDMISEVDFGSRMLDATLILFTINKQHRFTSFKHRNKLRELTAYIQQRVMELRFGDDNADLASRPTVSMQTAEPGIDRSLAQAIPAPKVTRPMMHKHKLVGAAALHHAHLPTLNPYTRTSFMVRSQFYGAAASINR